jgi:hypothetical protein
MMLHSGSYILGMRCAMYVDNVLSVVFRALCSTHRYRLSKSSSFREIIGLFPLLEVQDLNTFRNIKNVFVIYQRYLSDQANPLCKMITKEEPS